MTQQELNPLSPEVAYEQIKEIAKQSAPSPQLVEVFRLSDAALLLLKQLRGQCKVTVAVLEAYQASGTVDEDRNPVADAETMLRATAHVEVYDYLINLHESATSPQKDN